MKNKFDDLNARVTSNDEGMKRNSQLFNDAVDHANQLAQQAMNLKDPVTSAKEPAKKILEAADAYLNIAQAVTDAIESANNADQTADQFASIVNTLSNIYIIFLNGLRGTSLLESRGTTFLLDWQPPLIFD